MRSYLHLLNTLSTSFSSTSQNDTCLDPCTPPGPHPSSLDHHPFRPTSITLKMGKHEAVDLLVPGSNTATPPATAFVTSPPRFRFHHLQKVQTQSKAVRVRAIAHFACFPLYSHHDPSRSFSYLAFVPHLAVFSYLALCPYFAFFFPSCCLLLSWLLSMLTLALFAYSIFHSLPIQTSVQSESRTDWGNGISFKPHLTTTQ